MSARSKTAADARRRQNEFACAELLKRLIEYHPDLPIGVRRTPGTRCPIRLDMDRAELLAELGYRRSPADTPDHVMS